ncbi:MAG: aspartate aminotransferase family protein [Actinobacteria bacterium]|nr:aspartate aminotransferase family protein [Actinomycetota bacterium]
MSRSSAQHPGPPWPPDPRALRSLLEQETALFERAHPVSKELYARGCEHFLYGAPMHWMQQWAGSYPIYVSEARGARVTDVDGNEYVDFALGDTGAMFGHANPAVTAAISDQLSRGSTMMLPTEDSLWVGEELARRFGLPYWQVTTSATDANRFVIRLCRMISGRSKVVTFNWNYHGSVDETQVELDERGRMVPRTGVHPNAMHHEQTTRLVEFNNVPALEEALAHGDVACVLTEPVLTNIGMVPADPGYHEALRRLTREHDVPLVIDETHTISTGPAGYTGEFNLEPDFFILGKSIAGGIPVAVWGTSQQMAERIWSVLPHFRAGEDINHFGFGGTLAGSALQIRAIRATLEEVLTEENYQHMIMLAERLEDGIRAIIARYRLPWHVTRIGARVEYLFLPRAPRNGGEAHRGRHALLEAFIHLFLLNRGVLLTPFHNMALMCPFTQAEDVDEHNRLLDECLLRVDPDVPGEMAKNADRMI